MRVQTLPWLAVLATTLVSSTPALAQAYHYNYGGGRIIQQNQTGLWYPAATYLDGANLTPSATGKINTNRYGLTNPLLPRVDWGRSIGTGGDQYYQTKDDSDYWLRKPLPRRPQIRRDNSWRFNPYYQQQPPGTLYVPGQNAVDSNPYHYGYSPNSSGQGQNAGGVATYAEFGYQEGTAGARSF